MFHSYIGRTYFGLLEHRAQRPCSTKVSKANLSRTVVSVPRPPARSTAIHSPLQRGGAVVEQGTEALFYLRRQQKGHGLVLRKPCPKIIMIDTFTW